MGPSALLVAARYCRERGALLIVDPPSAWHTADDALRAMRDWQFSTEDALMYFPRIFAHDKLRGHFESFAPCGAVAGMLARIDESSPVWGPANSMMRCCGPGTGRPAWLRKTAARGSRCSASTRCKRCARSRASAPNRARSARGAAGAQDWQSLAARRLALFIVNSIEHGTRWVRRADPEMDVAEAVATQTRLFFEQLYEAGAFPGRRIEEAFFVICDRRYNRRMPLRSSEFQFLIGFAATRPAEFHGFRISHSVAGTQGAVGEPQSH